MRPAVRGPADARGGPRRRARDAGLQAKGWARRAATPAPRPALGAIVIENLALPRPGEDRIDADAIEKDAAPGADGLGDVHGDGGNVDAGAAPQPRARASRVTAETVELDTKG